MRAAAQDSARGARKRGFERGLDPERSIDPAPQRERALDDERGQRSPRRGSEVTLVRRERAASTRGACQACSAVSPKRWSCQVRVGLLAPRRRTRKWRRTPERSEDPFSESNPRSCRARPVPTQLYAKTARAMTAASGRGGSTEIPRPRTPINGRLQTRFLTVPDARDRRAAAEPSIPAINRGRRISSRVPWLSRPDTFRGSARASHAPRRRCRCRASARAR